MQHLLLKSALNVTLKLLKVFFKQHNFKFVQSVLINTPWLYHAQAAQMK